MAKLSSWPDGMTQQEAYEHWFGDKIDRTPLSEETCKCEEREKEKVLEKARPFKLNANRLVSIGIILFRKMVQPTKLRNCAKASDALEMGTGRLCACPPLKANPIMLACIALDADIFYLNRRTPCGNRKTQCI